jgi:hypothetical protein
MATTPNSTKDERVEASMFSATQVAALTKTPLADVHYNLRQGTIPHKKVKGRGPTGLEYKISLETLQAIITGKIKLVSAPPPATKTASAELEQKVKDLTELVHAQQQLLQRLLTEFGIGDTHWVVTGERQPMASNGHRT